MSNIIIELADNVYAGVNRIEVKYYYSGVIEAVPGALTHNARYREVPMIQHHISNIKSGNIKGRYCMEPELMDELDFWDNDVPEHYAAKCGKCIKEYELEVDIEILRDDGLYTIVLELFLSSRELAATPIVDLIRQNASKLSFAELKWYCNFLDWENY